MVTSPYARFEKRRSTAATTRRRLGAEVWIDLTSGDATPQRSRARKGPRKSEAPFRPATAKRPLSQRFCARILAEER